MQNSRLFTGVKNTTLILTGLATLFISSSTLAKEKIDSTVQYKKHKPYCNKGLQLFYSPAKDQYFCSRIRSPLTDKYIYINPKSQKPYCKKPYMIAYTGSSKLFKKKPRCILIKS